VPGEEGPKGTESSPIAEFGRRGKVKVSESLWLHNIHVCIHSQISTVAKWCTIFKVYHVPLECKE